jgi:hypothetical protein
VLEANDMGLTTASFAFDGGRWVFTAKAGDRLHRITCGQGVWQLGEASMPGTPPRLISGGKSREDVVSKVAASATWTDDKTLLMTWRYYETPHRDSVTCRFEDDRVTLSFLNSITAMNPKAKDARLPLTGKLTG